MYASHCKYHFRHNKQQRSAPRRRRVFTPFVGEDPEEVTVSERILLVKEDSLSDEAIYRRR